MAEQVSLTVDGALAVSPLFARVMLDTFEARVERVVEAVARLEGWDPGASLDDVRRVVAAALEVPTQFPEASCGLYVLVVGSEASIFIRRGDGWGRRRYEAPDEEEPYTQQMVELALSCGNLPGARVVRVADEAAAIQLLFDTTDTTEMSQVTAWLLDGKLTDKTRRSAAEELDELLGYDEMRAQWLKTAQQNAPTDEMDVAGARRIAAEVSAVHVVSCLDTWVADTGVVAHE